MNVIDFLGKNCHTDEVDSHAQKKYCQEKTFRDYFTNADERAVRKFEEMIPDLYTNVNLHMDYENILKKYISQVKKAAKSAEDKRKKAVNDLVAQYWQEKRDKAIQTLNLYETQIETPSKKRRDYIPPSGPSRSLG